MKLPRDVDGAQAVRALLRVGFVVQRQTGSHVILRREGRTVVVPQHKPLKPGTLKGMLDQAAVTLERFVEEL
ncbi:MAG: type II toxin-antitoxin system HicA family toxin [Verrucomicrobiales bacterium]|nr:type II toxin-antitoxin system HicA family toxin [Verrucomicrobiales bacterium]